jgi:hypothetical protein
MLDLRRSSQHFLIALVAFCFLVLAVCLLWQDNLCLLLLMCMEAAVALRFWHDGYDVSFFLVIGGLGSLAEALFVRAGAWQYANPSALGVPLWFPVAFGTAGLLGGRMARALVAIWQMRDALLPSSDGLQLRSVISEDQGH